MHPSSHRLFAADEALRGEADDMLARSGIGAILRRAGYQAVGSYAMRTMTWRDLDFERYEEPDWQRHWEVGEELARTGWCWRLNCVDAYRDGTGDKGLYWGVRLRDPATPDGAVWKLDVWTARPEEFTVAPPKRQTWEALMTEEARSHILAIKEVVCVEPEYRKTLLSVHVYEAVLEHGVRELDDFRTWWRTTYGEGNSPQRH